MSFIAGRYTATYNGKSLGQTADGFRLSKQFFKRLIKGDAYAETTQDAVYRGCDIEEQMTLIEFNAPGVADALTPYGPFFSVGIVGVTDVGSSKAKSLVLTAIAGTPAANTPASITLPRTIIKEGFPIEILYAPDLREVPLRLRTYPNAQGLFGSQN